MTTDEIILGEKGVQFIKERKNGEAIQFEYRDSDDYTEWKFKYIKSKKGRIYLGGGIDFGTAVGKILTEKDILNRFREGGAYYEYGVKALLLR